MKKLVPYLLPLLLLVACQPERLNDVPTSLGVSLYAIATLFVVVLIIVNFHFFAPSWLREKIADIDPKDIFWLVMAAVVLLLVVWFLLVLTTWNIWIGGVVSLIVMTGLYFFFIFEA